jgi:predicted TPR repeat methyltransferase
MTPHSFSWPWSSRGLYTSKSTYDVLYQGHIHEAMDSCISKSKESLKCKIFILLGTMNFLAGNPVWMLLEGGLLALVSEHSNQLEPWRIRERHTYRNSKKRKVWYFGDTHRLLPLEIEEGQSLWKSRRDSDITTVDRMHPKWLCVLDAYMCGQR